MCKRGILSTLLHTPTSKMSSLAQSILDFLLPAIEAHKARRWNVAPEVTIFPDDRWFEWAEDLVYKYEGPCRDVIVKASKDDMTALFAALTDDLWPAHRRAFASKLYQFAVEVEEGGLNVSKGFAEFYRERYNPNYKFLVELPTLKAGEEVKEQTLGEMVGGETCAGCAEGLANQLGHMGAGGCLVSEEEK